MCSSWLPYVPLFIAIFINSLTDRCSCLPFMYESIETEAQLSKASFGTGSLNCHPAVLTVDQQVHGEADLSLSLPILDCLEECRMSLFPLSSQPNLPEIINISMMLFQNYDWRTSEIVDLAVHFCFSRLCLIKLARVFHISFGSSMEDAVINNNKLFKRESGFKSKRRGNEMFELPSDMFS